MTSDRKRFYNSHLHLYSNRHPHAYAQTVSSSSSFSFDMIIIHAMIIHVFGTSSLEIPVLNNV